MIIKILAQFKWDNEKFERTWEKFDLWGTFVLRNDKLQEIVSMFICHLLTKSKILSNYPKNK